MMKKLLLIFLLISVASVSSSKVELILDVETTIASRQVSMQMFAGGMIEIIADGQLYTSELSRGADLVDQLISISDELSDGDDKVYLFADDTKLNGSYDLQSNGKFYSLIEKIFYRVSGLNYSQNVWPVDISVQVLESFPEKYAVNTFIKRGNDLLTYVVEEEVNLYVLNIRTSQIIYNSTMHATLNSGGSTVRISFDTFSVGSKYAPSDLKFIVKVGSIAIDDSWDDYDVKLLTNFLNTVNTTSVDTIFYFPLTVALIILVVIRRNPYTN